MTYTIHDGQYSKYKSAVYTTLLGIHIRSLISLNSEVEPQKQSKSQRKKDHRSPNASPNEDYNL